MDGTSPKKRNPAKKNKKADRTSPEKKTNPAKKKKKADRSIPKKKRRRGTSAVGGGAVVGENGDSDGKSDGDKPAAPGIGSDGKSVGDAAPEIGSRIPLDAPWTKALQQQLLSEVPEAAHPPKALGLNKCYTLKNKGWKSRVQVLLTKRIFYVLNTNPEKENDVTINKKGGTNVPWFGDPAGAWVRALTIAGWADAPDPSWDC